MAESTTLDIRQITGRWVLEGASQVGRLTYFVLDMVRGLREVRIWWPRMMIEAWNIGAGSLFIVLLISAFAGAGWLVLVELLVPAPMLKHAMATTTSAATLRELFNVSRPVLEIACKHHRCWVRLTA